MAAAGIYDIHGIYKKRGQPLMPSESTHRDASLHPERNRPARGPFAPQIIAILALLSALNAGIGAVDNARIRLIVSASCVFLAYRASKKGSSGWTWILAATGFIYFPFVPLNLSPEMWSYVYMATIVLLAATFNLFGKRDISEQEISLFKSDDR